MKKLEIRDALQNISQCSQRKATTNHFLNILFYVKHVTTICDLRPKMRLTHFSNYDTPRIYNLPFN